MTHIPGKPSEEERVQAAVDAALNAIYDAHDERIKAEKSKRKVDALAKEEIGAAERAFEAAIEEAGERETAKTRIAKLDRVEQAWTELKAKEAEHGANKTKAKNELDAAEQKLIDAIEKSRQGSLAFGDALDDAEEHSALDENES